MNNLSIKQRQALKGLAHNLDPVVMIGDKGVTTAVIKEVETNLTAHELIKIRVLGNDRIVRLAAIDEICLKTSAHLVQHIGKLIVLYRPSEKNKIVIK